MALQVLIDALRLKQGKPEVVSRDEYQREPTPDALATMPGVVAADARLTAGHASCVNDGAHALRLAPAKRLLQPTARNHSS